MSIEFHIVKTEDDSVIVSGFGQKSNDEYMAFYFNYDEISNEDKVKYDNFRTLQVDSFGFKITNAPYSTTGMFGVIEPTTEIVLELDYNTMSVEDKSKVDAFEEVLNNCTY